MKKLISADVTITAFRSSGVVYNGSSATDGVPSQFNTPFTLEPNETSLLCVNRVSGATEHGYATITSERTYGSSAEPRLIANAYWVNGDRQMHIPVNNSLPF